MATPTSSQTGARDAVRFVIAVAGQARWSPTWRSPARRFVAGLIASRVLDYSGYGAFVDWS